MFRKLRPIILMAPIFASGCASTPQGTISYYFPKAQTQLTITQTLSCDAKGEKVGELLTVTPVTAYVSDLTAPRWTIEPKSFDGALTDTDLTLNFTDDGRLSAINLTNVGQGSTVIQDIASIAKTIGPVVAAAQNTQTDQKEACAVIADFGGKAAGKAAAKAAKDGADPGGDVQPASSAPPSVSLTYVARLEYGLLDLPASDATANTAECPATPDRSLKVQVGVRSLDKDNKSYSPEIEIDPDPGSTAIYNELIKYLPKLPLEFDIKDATQMLSSKWQNPSASDIQIGLNSVASVIIQVKGPTTAWTDRNAAWTGQVPVPLTDSTHLYCLPIPKAAIFGTTKFALGLSAYGSIEKLEYSTTGASDAANSANAAAGELAAILKKPTASDQAASIQAQSDLIYQQQRLIACQSAPKSCSSK